MVTVICNYCNKEFKTHPSQIKYRGGKFCSRACYDASRRIQKICAVCGKSYSFGRKHRSNKNSKYCSSFCQHIGFRGEHYKENRSTYPTEFKKIRLEIIKLQNGKCLICGKNADCVHHINYDKQDSCSLNLVLLCRSCHTKTNYDRDFWETRINHIIGLW